MALTHVYATRHGLYGPSWEYCTGCGCSKGFIEHMKWSVCEGPSFPRLAERVCGWCGVPESQALEDEQCIVATRECLEPCPHQFTLTPDLDRDRRHVRPKRREPDLRSVLDMVLIASDLRQTGELLATGTPSGTPERRLGETVLIALNNYREESK